MKRPVGITIIGIVFILLALVSGLWSGVVLGFGALTAAFGGLFGLGGIGDLGASSGWTGFLGVIVACLQIAVAIGLLSMARWAWWLAIVGVGVSVIQGLVGAFTGGPFAFMCGAFGLVIPIVILIYLLLPRVRAVFGLGPTETAEASE